MLLNGEVEDTPWKEEHMLLILGGGWESPCELPHELDWQAECSLWSELLYRLALQWNGVEDMMLMEALLYLKDQEGGNF